MRVLLFGASGFIGKHAHAALTAAGAEVLPTGRRGPIRHDLVVDGPARLASLLAAHRPDAVVNCAGLLSGSTAELVEANVTAVARLVDACSFLGTRLVTLGSAAEYGVVPHGVPVAEDAPCRPVGGYGVTRLAATELVRLAVADHRLDGVVLRVFNPLGAGLPADNVLGRALRQVPSGTVRLGPLGAYRDFVDGRDVGSAVALATCAATLPEPVLNVGSGAAVPTREAVRLLCAAAGFAGELVEGDVAPGRSAGVDWIAADLTRIRATLGWAPAYDLEAAVKELLL
ncbi:snoG protein [Longispora fulva]|uniref:Nucleoside-diphosphate-sugar epimerase n=1 Tax=Longispora fulva TaxID=619741 RepID=A0A8J7GUY1_9ACTN|nr:NAD(P)-dependent oxidoreductase [Longispora fulva]MBG6137881.1 nucleoside-diphosphate-sugar epimerase [Longispora fulva]GIG60135.1 snoG protein [Longispora fulva]